MTPTPAERNDPPPPTPSQNLEDEDSRRLRRQKEKKRWWRAFALVSREDARRYGALLRFAKPYRGKLALSLLLSLTGSAFLGSQAVILQRGLDQIDPHANAEQHDCPECRAPLVVRKVDAEKSISGIARSRIRSGPQLVLESQASSNAPPLDLDARADRAGAAAGRVEGHQAGDGHQASRRTV